VRSAPGLHCRLAQLEDGLIDRHGAEARELTEESSVFVEVCDSGVVV